MDAKDIKKLFPLKIAITPEHRKLAIEKGGLHKLGEVLLIELLPEELHENLFWGLSIGTVKGVTIKTEIDELPIYLDKNFDGNEIKFELR